MNISEGQKIVNEVLFYANSFNEALNCPIEYTEDKQKVTILDHTLQLI
jgi:hypothetical protein